jgi:hypothetical protein
VSVVGWGPGSSCKRTTPLQHDDGAHCGFNGRLSRIIAEARSILHPPTRFASPFSSSIKRDKKQAAGRDPTTTLSHTPNPSRHRTSCVWIVRSIADIPRSKKKEEKEEEKEEEEEEEDSPPHSLHF